jgi:N-acetylglucosamine-6-phosphate deacetylase
MAVPGPGARVLGAHIEGPYISPARTGAQDPRYLRSPDDGTAGMWAAYRDVLRIMALAPELPGALELIADLSAAGIIPAAGHSDARDTHVAAAMAAGLRHITHLWCGQSSLVREGPWRLPGLLEASLAYDGLTVEIICDNRHLPATLMRLAWKAIGPDRLCAISDATGGAGLPEGSRFTMGAMDYEVRAGAGMMLDGSSLAGGATFLNEMIPILTGVAGVPLPEAVRMVTLTPAHILGVDDCCGSIAPGKVADLAAFNDDFTVWRTMIAGRRVYVQDLPSTVGRCKT